MTQTLDVTAFWRTLNDLRVHVVASTAAFYVCIKLRDNPLQRIGAGGVLPDVVERAPLLVDRAKHENVSVFVEHIVHEQCTLLRFAADAAREPVQIVLLQIQALQGAMLCCTY